MSRFNITYSTSDGYSVSHYSQMVEAEAMEKSTRKFLGLYFNLGNKIHYTIANIRSGVILKNHYNLVNLPPQTPCELVMLKKGKYTFICIQFTPSYLSMGDEEFPILAEFLKNEKLKIPAVLNNTHLMITAEMHDIIQAILRNRYRGVIREAYLGAKVLDLLMLCLKHICINNVSQPIRHRFYAKKIQDAHDYLMGNISTSCSINMVASKLGINKRRLTKGFKDLFGKTIHSFILDERMRQAKIMLRNTNKQIREIAELVGYKNSSNFTEVFKKKFGYSPQSLRQNNLQDS